MFIGQRATGMAGVGNIEGQCGHHIDSEYRRNIQRCLPDRPFNGHSVGDFNFGQRANQVGERRYHNGERLPGFV